MAELASLKGQIKAATAEKQTPSPSSSSKDDANSLQLDQLKAELLQAQRELLEKGKNARTVTTPRTAGRSAHSPTPAASATPPTVRAGRTLGDLFADTEPIVDPPAPESFITKEQQDKFAEYYEVRLPQFPRKQKLTVSAWCDHLAAAISPSTAQVLVSRHPAHDNLSDDTPMTDVLHELHAIWEQDGSD